MAVVFPVRTSSSSGSPGSRWKRRALPDDQGSLSSTGYFEGATYPGGLAVGPGFEQEEKASAPKAAAAIASNLKNFMSYYFGSELIAQA